MARPVHILSLTLSTFRNHQLTRIATDAPLVVLTGPNGAGKTNILEALSLLAPGRGLRGAALRDIAAAGGPGGFAVQASIRTDPDLPPLEARSFAEPQAPDRRRLLLNGAAAPLSALAEWLSILWLTPAMDRLFTEAASGRRRFLDRLVLALHPGHGSHASRYDAAMRARSRLLQGTDRPDPLWLDALEAQMASHGTALADARRTTVQALAAAIAARADSSFPRATLQLAGDQPDADWAALLAASRAQDTAAGRVTRGPHRVDLAVSHADKAMPAAQASTGEQKALLTAILLAHAELVAERTGRVPLLLLDEAAAHLDPDRRTALFARVAALGGQCWTTGTDASLFAGLDAAHWTVADGAVRPG